MNILFLSENYFPNVSGVPVVVRYLAEGLLKKNHKVGVATTCFENEPRIDCIGGVDVYRFHLCKDFFHRYKGDIREYVEFVKNYPADIIIIECSQCVTTDILLPHLKYINAKIIFHSHGFSGLESPFFAIRSDVIHTLGTTYNWIESRYYFGVKFKKALKYFDASLCLSEVDNSKPYLDRLAKNVYVLDNAAEEMFYREININNTLSKYATLENDTYFMSCANYQYVKDQISIINQYYRSEASKSNSLVCIGSRANDYYQQLVEVVKENEIKFGHRDVILLIGVERADIPAIINKAKLYIVASRCERYSISIIEAMSQGIPFVSTNVGNSSILPGGVTVNNTNEIHEQIDRSVSNNALYSRYASAGKSFAYENCRIEAVVEKLNRIILNL